MHLYSYHKCSAHPALPVIVVRVNNISRIPGSRDDGLFKLVIGSWATYWMIVLKGEDLKSQRWHGILRGLSVLVVQQQQ